jgi:hypothetical protein
MGKLCLHAGYPDASWVLEKHVAVLVRIFGKRIPFIRL